ncbi:lipase family protein [Nocardia sp. NPDC003183]
MRADEQGGAQRADECVTASLLTSLCLAEQQPSYAPELDLRGVVAGSAPIDMATLFKAATIGALSGASGYLLHTLAAQ